MQHKYTIYYMLGGEATDFEACQSYECDYRAFDPLTGVLVCRKLGDDGTFCEELAFPANFFMGEVKHRDVQTDHDKYMKKETEMQTAMRDIMNSKQEPNHGAEVG